MRRSGITSKNRNIPNNPATEEWQKVLGSYDMWSSADVFVAGKMITMRVTVRAHDRYNFNNGSVDIVTGEPDAANGRFAQLGWASGFNTSGSLSRDVTWPLGSESQADVSEPLGPRW